MYLNKSKQYPGFFITLEGPEGGGKTTLANRLYNALWEKGYEVLPTREPGGTSLGEKVRRLLVAFNDEVICPQAEALLFQASRAQLVEKVIRPYLQAGGIVLCDRYADSTLAYQGYGAGGDLNSLRELLQYATGGLWPDLTILLDLDVEVGLSRRELSGEKNRIDLKELDFHRRVRDGFLTLARQEPDRCAVISAQRDPDTVFNDVFHTVLSRLPQDVLRAQDTETQP